MKFVVATVAVALTWGVAFVPAEAVGIFCVNPPANIGCAGTLTYTPDSATHGALTVSLTNNSIDTSILTAIVLSFPTFEGATFGSATLTAPASWQDGFDGMNTGFQIGAEADPPPVNNGVPPGGSQTWVWDLTGTNFGVLDSGDFTSSSNRVFNCNTSSGTERAWGCVHFQRTTTAPGSEKVRLAATPPTVAEPGTLMLLGTALAGLGILGRRMYRK